MFLLPAPYLLPHKTRRALTVCLSPTAGVGDAAIDTDAGRARHDGFVEIRRARDRDAHQIAETWLRSRGAAVPAIPPPVHPPDEVHAWFEAVVLPDTETWIAEEDGTVFALLVLDEDWIEQLYVAPGHTGHGLGSDLVNLAKACRPQGL